MKLNNSQSLLISSILGMASILAPVLILQDLKSYDAPLFPMLRTGLEGISLYSLAFLFTTGFVVKMLSDSSCWRIGFGCMTLFPLAAICEIIYDPTSHNLIPLEFIFYALYALPAVLGAYVAELIAKLISKRTT
ncbi:MAG: hypothetical protein ACKVJH_05855 [Flavobacteriales bacterium]